ncbi:LA2681 family HEPN domain-containing protein [Methanobrevibacter sp. UBA412]|jgi:tetratricopeptide (TPR) repeat protein|uniref:LA2681 family HEPN domain-containing protein n=1 Tax=Methanobrevibacter sp. UBA412 TaxID=1915486 RepID=UPI0039B92C43
MEIEPLLRKMFDEAYEKIDNNDLEGAMQITEEIKNLNSEYGTKNAISGLLIDIGQLKKDEDKIIEGISIIQDLIKNYLKRLSNGEIENLYYNLANGYSALFKIKALKNRYYSYYKKDTELNQAIKYYKKALSFNSPHNPNEYINLGNSLDYEGRKIEALDYYEEALKFNLNYGLALINKGIALFFYYRFSEKSSYLKESYDCFNKALEDKLSINNIQLTQEYINHINNMTSDKDLLKKPFNPKKIEIKTNNSFEKFLINFCLENKLYLNTCNFCQKCENAIGDPIFINKMIISADNEFIKLDSKNNSFLRLSSYLNQIKEDYITARYLLILSRYKKLDLSFINKNVILIETLEYKPYNIKLQLLMFSLKSMYDILDKIAFFLNDYLNLGFKEYEVNFKKIWYKNGDFRKGNVNENIEKIKDSSLNALFKLSVELNSSEPRNIFNQLRNKITHRFLDISLMNTENEIMTEKKLEEYTISLSKIVRSAIIYLITFVNEKEKKNEIKDKIPTFELKTP